MKPKTKFWPVDIYINMSTARNIPTQNLSVKIFWTLCGGRLSFTIPLLTFRRLFCRIPATRSFAGLHCNQMDNSDYPETSRSRKKRARFSTSVLNSDAARHDHEIYDGRYDRANERNHYSRPLSRRRSPICSDYEHTYITVLL